MAGNCFKFVSSCFKFVMEVTGNQMVAARQSEKVLKNARKIGRGILTQKRRGPRRRN
jgi:hypothetical protein